MDMRQHPNVSQPWLVERLRKPVQPKADTTVRRRPPWRQKSEHPKG